jgi:hypothetical protein
MAVFLWMSFKFGFIGGFSPEGRRSYPLRPSGAHHLPHRGNIISPRFSAVNIIAPSAHIICSLSVTDR